RRAAVPRRRGTGLTDINALSRAPLTLAPGTTTGIETMTTFNDRERAEEGKFARDEEFQFRIIARRNRLLGEWAAEKLGLSAAETEAYAKSVVQADFEEAGDEDVIRKVLGDLISGGVEASDAEVRAALDAKLV